MHTINVLLCKLLFWAAGQKLIVSKFKTKKNSGHTPKRRTNMTVVCNGNHNFSKVLEGNNKASLVFQF